MPFSKGDPNINRKGRPPDVKSMKAIYRQKLTQPRRERIADKFIEEAEAGSIPHWQAIATALGEQQQPAGPNFNILAFIADADRLAAQRAFAALAMGVRDAGGLGVVRQSGELDTVAAPDDGERRSDADREG